MNSYIILLFCGIVGSVVGYPQIGAPDDIELNKLYSVVQNQNIPKNPLQLPYWYSENSDSISQDGEGFWVIIAKKLPFPEMTFGELEPPIQNDIPNQHNMLIQHGIPSNFPLLAYQKSEISGYPLRYIHNIPQKFHENPPYVFPQKLPEQSQLQLPYQFPEHFQQQFPYYFPHKPEQFQRNFPHQYPASPPNFFEYPQMFPPSFTSNLPNIFPQEFAEQLQSHLTPQSAHNFPNNLPQEFTDNLSGMFPQEFPYELPQEFLDYFPYKFPHKYPYEFHEKPQVVPSPEENFVVPDLVVDNGVQNEPQVPSRTSQSSQS